MKNALKVFIITLFCALLTVLFSACDRIFINITSKTCTHQLEVYNDKEATCTEVGYKVYRVCTLCGYNIYVDKKEALGHNYEKSVCRNCGDTLGDSEDEIDIGNRVGNRCLATDLAYVSGYGNGTLNINDLRGKVVVLNFWGAWCAPCKQELPYFNQVASEYSTDDVVVITIHTSWNGDETPSSYISNNYPNSNMLFVVDSKLSGSEADAYYTALGGKGSYPMTLVLDERGVITEKVSGSMEYEELKAAVDEVLGEAVENF